LGEGHVIDWNTHYRILQCQGCDSISFRKASHTSDDYIQVDPDEYEIDVLEEIFPNPLRIGGLFRLEIELAA